jgi:hypothetical protein
MIVARRVRSIVAPISVGLLVSVLAACGGGGSAGGGTDVADAQSALAELNKDERSATRAGSRTSAVSCDGPAPAEFGSGELCVDSGYRQESKFSFANWGNYQYSGDTFDPSEFVTLFGADNVCVNKAAEDCELTNQAKERLELLNKQVAGGRCEGMVVMSALLASGAVKIEDLKPGATAVSDLDPNDPKLINQIDYWWATQFAPQVLADTAEIRADGVEGVLDALLRGLKNGVFSTMGIYSKTSGHALLPVGVTRNSDGTFNVIVYDSNLPDILSKVVIDTKMDTWEYLEGAVNPGQAQSKWSGTSGTIELTPLISREVNGNCDFCNDASSSATKVTAELIPLPPKDVFDSLFQVETD